MKNLKTASDNGLSVYVVRDGDVVALICKAAVFSYNFSIRISISTFVVFTRERIPVFT